MADQTTELDSLVERADELHRKLRGTDDLLYYPPHLACTQMCGCVDNNLNCKHRSPLYVDHQCYYAPKHAGNHKYSSECAMSITKEVVDELSGFGTA